MKRLVFCFDGTSNRLVVENPTNVVLTAESVLPLADDQKTAQLIFYDEGVGNTKGEKAAGYYSAKASTSVLPTHIGSLSSTTHLATRFIFSGSPEEPIPLDLSQPVSTFKHPK